MRKVGCFGLIIGLALIAALFWVGRDWSGAGPAEKPLAIVVPDGASLGRAAGELEKQGAIRSARRFRGYARIFGTGTPIKAGEYAIPARASAADILALLEEGKVRQRLVPVPEGYPSILVHEALMRAEGLTGDVAVPREGSILPDSYA
jgi:UPF0755 protein